MDEGRMDVTLETQLRSLLTFSKKKNSEMACLLYSVLAYCHAPVSCFILTVSASTQR